MQIGDTSTTATRFPIREGDIAQCPTRRAKSEPNTMIVIALTASETGISFIPARITISYVYSVKLATTVKVVSSHLKVLSPTDLSIRVKDSVTFLV